MKKFLLIFVLLLSGCAFDSPVMVTPEPVLIKQIEYVVKIPPTQLITLPPIVEKIDVDTAKQSDIARWILNSENRTQTLESMLRGIAVFFEVEQAKAEDAANELNKKALIDAAQAQADAATAATTNAVKLSK